MLYLYTTLNFFFSKLKSLTTNLNNVNMLLLNRKEFPILLSEGTTGYAGGGIL